MASWLECNKKLGNGKSEELKAVEEEEGEDELAFCMEKMVCFVVPMALRTAFELGVFDVLAKAGEGAKLSANDIAVQIGSNNPEAPSMLDRLLSLLVSHSMLSCSVPHPQSSNRMELKGAILEGGVPFHRAHGMNPFEYSSVDPRFNEVFHKGMVGITTLIMKKILESYKGFEQVTKVVDVGGGLGVNLKLITSKYPHLQAIDFDLPHVVHHAPIYAGVEHVGGDMFVSVPSGDAIFMKWILHDWSDEQCLKLLKNCYKAIPDDGKVIIVDAILSIVPETTVTAKRALGSDLIMMTQNPGGKERTQQEFIELAKRSGFGGIRFICCVSGYWVMEFHK